MSVPDLPVSSAPPSVLSDVPTAALSALDRSVLTLTKSGLTLDGGVLIRHTKAVTVARHELTSVVSASMTHRFDPFAAILAVAAGAIATLCKTLIETPLWSWSLFAVFAAVTLIGLISVLPAKLTLETHHGTVHYPLVEATDEITGFYLSLKERMSRIGGGVSPNPSCMDSST